MRIKDLCKLLEQAAPLALQEEFDNAGLLVGDYNEEIQSCLVSLDITAEVIDEAIRIGANLIIAHHPLIFKGLKNLVPDGGVNDILLKCIKHNIALYAAHTNLDKVPDGVSGKLATRLGLINQSILLPDKNALLKLVVFVPEKHLSSVSASLFNAGAGNIGKYDSCSFRSPGEGRFRASSEAKPFLGSTGEFHKESEIKLEVILPKYLKSDVVKALLNSHPYEEVAYDLIALENENPYTGLGVIGDLPESSNEMDFLEWMKRELGLSSIRHTKYLNKEVTRIAVCGGSGSEFLSRAIASGAQIYVSADFKYHQFFEAGDRIMIADIGHYESEQLAKEELKGIVTKKFPNFAVHLSKINTNPIKYF